MSESNAPLVLLSSFESGVVTIGVNGFPLAKLDADAKSVDVDANGVKETGIKLSEIMPSEGRGNVLSVVKNSEALAKGLSESGWRITLYDKGKGILTVGRGVSRLTGYVSVNPLRLKKILEFL